jgi:hypothetical protein
MIEADSGFLPLSRKLGIRNRHPSHTEFSPSTPSESRQAPGAALSVFIDQIHHPSDFVQSWVLQTLRLLHFPQRNRFLLPARSRNPGDESSWDTLYPYPPPNLGAFYTLSHECLPPNNTCNAPTVDCTDKPIPISCLNALLPLEKDKSTIQYCSDTITSS